MLKIVTTFALLLSISISSAQVEITNIVHQSKNDLPLLDGFVIKHPKDDGYAVVLTDGKLFYLNGFDRDSNYKGRITVAPPLSRSSFMASMATEDGRYHLLFKKPGHTNLARQTIHFSNDSISTHEVPLNVLDQEILGTFQEDDGLHIISAERKNSMVYHHVLSPNFEVSTQPFHLHSIPFQLNGKEVAFHELFFNSLDGFSALGFDSNSPFPTTLPEATYTSKIVRQGNSLLFTIDRNPGVTQIIELNLEDGQVTPHIVSQLNNLSEKSIRQSNSYLKDSVLYQIVRTKDSLHLFATEWSTQTPINKHAIGPSEKIELTNTAVLQEKPSKRKRKEVDGDKFLRSLNSDSIGIVVNEVNGKQQITYGSWNESRGNNAKLDNSQNVDPVAGAMAGMFGVAGGLLYLAISQGTNSAHSYGLHHRGMTTRAIAVFDDEFTHLPDAGVQATIYHKIDYYNARREDTTPLLLFRLNDEIIYGSFYPVQNAIKLLKF
jgi:hypothetical protein